MRLRNRIHAVARVGNQQANVRPGLSHRRSRGVRAPTSMVSTRMLSVPPDGIASRAFIAKLTTTSSICRASARMSGSSMPATTRNVMLSPSIVRSIGSESVSRCTRESGRSSKTCRRPNASSCRVSDAAAADAWSMASADSRSGPSAGNAPARRSLCPLITVSRLLKSCARPPANRASSSIRSAPSSRDCTRVAAVTSTMVPRMDASTPAASVTTAIEQDTSIGSPLALWNCSPDGPARPLTCASASSRRRAGGSAEWSTRLRPSRSDGSVQPSICTSAPLHLVICQSGAASKRPHASSSNSSRHRASLAESAAAARTRSAVGTKVETASRRPTASKARHVCSTATGVPSSRVITARWVTDAATPESRSRIRSAVEGLTSATASASSEVAARTSGANPVSRAKAWFAYSTPPLEEITTAASAASVSARATRSLETPCARPSACIGHIERLAD